MGFATAAVDSTESPKFSVSVFTIEEQTVFPEWPLKSDEVISQLDECQFDGFPSSNRYNVLSAFLPFGFIPSSCR
jgi:hypothetical protein